MFTLCEKCRNHYDDTCQSKKCDGPGGKRGHTETHTSPAFDHRQNIRATRGEGGPNPRMIGESWPSPTR